MKNSEKKVHHISTSCDRMICEDGTSYSTNIIIKKNDGTVIDWLIEARHDLKKAEFDKVKTITDFYAVLEEMDSLFENPEGYVFDKAQLDELCKISHRPYSTGFYLGKPGPNEQVYTDSSYIRDYDLIGMVREYDEKTGIATISQRNRFFVGDEIEIIQPGKPFFCQTVKYMENEAGERIECAPHAQMIVKMPVDFPVTADAMLRKVSTKKGM